MPKWLMALKRIKYQGFRNLADAELEFADNFNFIIGKNGAGKTNLLEAIFYVGLASSFRIREEQNLIRVGEPFLHVDAETENMRAIVYFDGQKKKLTLQGNKVPRLSNYVGWLGITILSIEDIWMVRGTPSRRRAFMDWTIAKTSAVYLSNLIEYRKILRQRNRILQNGRDNKDRDVLELFDEQLIKTGNEIYHERADFLPKLKENIRAFGQELGLQELTLEYRSSCPDMKLNHDIIKRIRHRELIVGHTLVGPHRDDLLFSINARPLRSFASEGEERAGVISIKLAEAEILYEETGKRPIMLLDEVAAELDRDKIEVLLRLLKGQVFFASTQLPNFSKSNRIKGRFFSVERGVFEISPEN